MCGARFVDCVCVLCHGVCENLMLELREHVGWSYRYGHRMQGSKDRNVIRTWQSRPYTVNPLTRTSMDAHV